jgi:hypothetical protein
MSKYKSKYHWNYRLATKMYKSPDGPDRDERLFSVIEVYYNKKNKPDSYCEPNVLDGLESKKSIKWTLKKIKEALKKPIIDLDNFPAKWKKQKE